MNPLAESVERLTDPKAKPAGPARKPVELFIEQTDLTRPRSRGFRTGSPHDSWYATSTLSRALRASTKVAAMMLSLVETAKINRVDPELYLKLGRARSHPIHPILDVGKDGASLPCHPLQPGCR